MRSAEGPGSLRVEPLVDDVFADPEREATALPQGQIVIAPIADAVLLFHPSVFGLSDFEGWLHYIKISHASATTPF